MLKLEFLIKMVVNNIGSHIVLNH